MKFEVAFKEKDKSFAPSFKDVYVASAGGTEAAYEKGYNAGRSEGYAEGVERGKVDEYKRFLEGMAAGTEPSGDLEIEVGEIAQGAFAYAKNLNKVTLANAVTIGANAFHSSGIQSITIPKVETIGQSAFYMCRSLRDIVLPATLKELGATSLGYTTLTSVSFMGTPETIPAGAFTGSNSLTDIYVPWSEGEVANAPWGATKATIHYNSGVV